MLQSITSSQWFLPAAKKKVGQEKGCSTIFWENIQEILQVQSHSNNWQGFCLWERRIHKLQLKSIFFFTNLFLMIQSSFKQQNTRFINKTNLFSLHIMYS